MPTSGCNIYSLTSWCGYTNVQIIPIRVPDADAVRASLQTLADRGIKSLAVVLLHSYVYPEHEKFVGDIAKSMNCFAEISLSHEVMSMVKLVPRGHTACAAAYLTPKITEYLAGFTKGLYCPALIPASSRASETQPETFVSVALFTLWLMAAS